MLAMLPIFIPLVLVFQSFLFVFMILFFKNLQSFRRYAILY